MRRARDQLMSVVAGVDESADVVLLVGHNLAIEQFLERLTGDVHHMPTAALAQVSLTLDSWGEIRYRVGTIDWVVKPKELEKI